jgi:hypothetical protein
MKLFPQKRTNPNEIFPHPLDNETIFETPPCLVWLKDGGAENDTYTIKIEGEDGFFREYHSKKNYFCPPDALPAGKYKWNVFSGNYENGEKSFTISKNAVVFIRPTGKEIYDAIDEEVHPRALFFREDIAEIVKNHKKDIEVLKRNIAVAIEDGYPLPPYDPSFDEKTGGDEKLKLRLYLNYIREHADRNLIALALGWALLGDRRAAEHGKRSLLEIASWDHYAEGLAINCQKSDEAGLSVARTLAIAYDLLFDLLTKDERDRVLRTLALVASQSYDKIYNGNYESNPGNSHTGRVPAYLGMMAIMLKGYEKKETLLKYLDLVTDIYGGMFPHYGSEDGGWGEGVFYASSYTKWYIPFFCAVERYTEKSYFDRPFYQNLSNFFLHFADRDFENHPFGDGYWCKSEDEEWPGFFAQDPFRVYAEKFGPKEAKEKEEAILSPDIFKLHLLDVFLPSPKKPSQHITQEASLAHAFYKTGYLSMRSSFSTDGCMAVMARASRFASASHSHSDQGSFALFYEGTALVSPSGYYGRGWGTRHHMEWTNSTRAHNTIVLDGKGQPTFSEKPTGQIEYCKQDGDIFTARLKLDCAYEQLSTWTRSFTMDAKAKTLLVEDKLKAENDVKLDWMLHTLSLPKEENGRITVVRNKIKLSIEILEGLLPEISISDSFDVDLNEGIPNEKKAVMPPQYHITFRSASTKSHKIKVKFTVEKL